MQVQNTSILHRNPNRWSFSDPCHKNCFMEPDEEKVRLHAFTCVLVRARSR